MFVNGKCTEINASISLSELLHLLNYDSTKTAVELNGHIIAKAHYISTTVCNDDVIEIVSFVGGG